MDVDRDKVLKQGVKLQDVYQTMQCFMGGAFVNYFNRFGRQWQVYVQAEGDYRTQAENLGQFYVLNNASKMVPLAALTSMTNDHRAGIHHALQPLPGRADQRLRQTRLQFRPGHEGDGGGLRANHAAGHGLSITWA